MPDRFVPQTIRKATLLVLVIYQFLRHTNNIGIRIAPIAKFLPVIFPPLSSIRIKLIIPRINDTTRIIRLSKKIIPIHSPLDSENRRELKAIKNGIGSIRPQKAKVIAVIASLLTWTVTGFEESGGFVIVALQN